ncbi:MAG: RagB/SusD family nutrient uptake outer membrane protein [Parabacteroides sp.]|nr:RagB/SusD family nutrient uptake outer membrane protein [Parabacteroides sp.]
MKFKYCLLTLAFAGVVTNCNNGFLDEAPTDQLSDVSYWRIESDAVKYTNALYRYTPEPGNFVIMTDCYTDNAVPVHVNNDQGIISSGSATSSTSHFSQLWEKEYQGIRRCNIFFENIGKVEMDESSRKVLIGEVHFLRAFFYSVLVKQYGRVPILEKPLELNEAVPARNTAEEVYTFILKDLQAAEENLNSTASNIGRPTRETAVSLKALISLHFLKYDMAEEAARQVIRSGAYDLYTDYEKLFLPEGENCKEVIFDRQYVENAYDFEVGSWIDQYFAPNMSGGWEALSPTRNLIDEYEDINGKKITDPASIYDKNAPFANRDPRLKFSILHDGDVFGGKTYTSNLASGDATRTGYTMRKYINPDVVNDGDTPGWTNFIYIRYAEILLAYAEARNETSGPDENVYKAVNYVRQRPSVDMPALPDGLTQEQMREAIRHEKRVEFAFEGIHLYDLRRWKTAETAVTQPVYGKNDDDGKPIFIEQRKFNPNRDYLWAIPLTEIDLSKGTLTQNPGY